MIRIGKEIEQIDAGQQRLPPGLQRRQIVGCRTGGRLGDDGFAVDKRHGFIAGERCIGGCGHRGELRPKVIDKANRIHGTLEVGSPTLISNGDSDLPTDMSLLRDAVEGKALLPGSSIAGALRAYLAASNKAAADTLFGFSLKFRDLVSGEQTCLYYS